MVTSLDSNYNISTAVALCYPIAFYRSQHRPCSSTSIASVAASVPCAIIVELVPPQTRYPFACTCSREHPSKWLLREIKLPARVLDLNTDQKTKSL
jgi:hypothetical protein